MGLAYDLNTAPQPSEVGEERLRFAPTPLHTDAMIDECVRAVRKVLNEY